MKIKTILENYIKYCEEQGVPHLGRRCDICGKEISDNEPIVFIAGFPLLSDKANPSWWRILHQTCYTSEYEKRRVNNVLKTQRKSQDGNAIQRPDNKGIG